MLMPSTEERIAELERQLAELKHGPSKPRPSFTFEKIDPTARMSMPRSAMEAMANAVNTDLLRSIVSDNRPSPQSSSMLPKSEERQAPLNVAVERELKPPDGIRVLDRMMDVADAVDKAALAQRLGKLGK